MELDAMILVFLVLSFKPVFSLSSFTLIKQLLTKVRQKKGKGLCDSIADYRASQRVQKVLIHMKKPL